jgi:sulfur carrier protein
VILVNGEQTKLAPRSTVRELLAELAIDERGVAVAVDSEVVPRAEWDSFLVDDGARIEVLTAVQGG